MSALNPAQARSVRATFRHVSDLLEDVERAATGEGTAFNRRDADLTPEESRAMLELVTTLRTRMLEVMARLGVPPPDTDGSARWTARTALSFAEMALGDLAPHELRSYGALDPEMAEAAIQVESELKALVAQAQRLLEEAP